MADFFKFEADFVDSLRCIPMQVRYKLDSCGVKLKLADWNHINQAERETLVALPCTTVAEIQSYKEYLQQLIINRTGTLPGNLPIEPEPAWLDSSSIPINIQDKAQEIGVKITLTQWANLTPLQRFALIKLSRSGHENRNFPQAIAEFNLV